MKLQCDHVKFQIMARSKANLKKKKKKKKKIRLFPTSYSKIFLNQNGPRGGNAFFSCRFVKRIQKAPCWPYGRSNPNKAAVLNFSSVV